MDSERESVRSASLAGTHGAPGMALMLELQGLVGDADALLLYDGECPFCQRYTQWLRLRDTLQLKLEDARQHPQLAQSLDAAGYPLDVGMLLVWRGQLWHGEAALQRLALMSTRHDWFNRINHWLFSRRWLSRLAYLLLRSLRNLSLKLLGRSSILP